LSAPGSAATTGAIPTEAAAATTALLARTGFVHIQLPAIELSAIQGSDRLIAFPIIRHLDEPKASRLPRVAIGDDADTLNGAVTFK
jgi:hypothetical protein